jgi:ribonuclease-3
VVAEHVWRTHPDEPEGLLTPRRAEVVSGANLARWATTLDLGSLLRLGRGEEQMGGRAKESLLASALEAVLAVVYVEGGLEAARRAVGSLASW